MLCGPIVAARGDRRIREIRFPNSAARLIVKSAARRYFSLTLRELVRAMSKQSALVLGLAVAHDLRSYLSDSRPLLSSPGRDCGGSRYVRAAITAVPPIGQHSTANTLRSDRCRATATKAGSAKRIWRNRGHTKGAPWRRRSRDSMERPRLNPPSALTRTRVAHRTRVKLPERPPAALFSARCRLRPARHARTLRPRCWMGRANLPR